MKTQTPNTPCRIGDTVYAIRNHNGTDVIRSGVVSEMFYVGEQMDLCIVVAHVCRGRWGKNVFPSYDDAHKYLEAKNDL